MSSPLSFYALAKQKKWIYVCCPCALNGYWKRRLLTHGRPHGGYGNKTGTTNNRRIDVVCILGTSQIQDLDPSRVVCVLCSFSTLSLTHAPALYSYGLLASPGTDMPYPGSLPRMKGGRWDSRCSRLPRQWPLGQIELTEISVRVK